MKIAGVVTNVNLEPGSALSAVRVQVGGELVILNLPKALAKQLGATPDDKVTITVDLESAP